MKINLGTIETSASADFQTKGFDIGNKAVIMDILRGRMYSNPIKIICQEIMCNARDAHREVGKHDVPIEVTLPTSIEPTIEFRDYGPGITPERMAEIFIMYGNSTKRESNEQTGGYGLGSKTPFSYTDTYVVVSRTPDGDKMMRREYVAYIDDSRLGVMSLVKEEETDEAQGTSVVVSVKQGDVMEFQRQFVNITQWWDIKPNCTDEDIKWPEHTITYQTDVWVYVDIRFEPQSEYPMALVDGIPYKINLDHVYRNNFTHLRGIPIQIKFNTGDIDITANREDIDYSRPRTIEKIKESLEKAVKEIAAKHEEDINQAENLRDATLIFYRLDSVFRGAQVLKWKGITLKRRFYIDTHTTRMSNHCCISCYELDRRQRGSDVRRVAISKFGSPFDIREDCLFANRASSLPIMPRVKQIFLNNPNVNRIMVFTHKKKDNGYPSLDYLNEKNYWNELGVIDLDSIKISSRNGKACTHVSSPPARLKAWVHQDRWEKVENPDLEHGSGHYLILSGKQPHIDGNEIDNNFLRRVAFLYDNDIHGAFARFQKKLGRGWQEITLADIRKRAKEVIMSDPSSQYKIVSWHDNATTNAFLKALKGEVAEDHKLIKYFNLAGGRSNTHDIDRACGAYEAAGGKKDDLKLRHIDIETEIFEKYPMLMFLQDYMYRRNKEKLVPELIEYLIYKIRRGKTNEVCESHSDTELSGSDVRQGIAKNDQEEPGGIRQDSGSDTTG